MNRATLLKAADTVFSRHGFDAPLELVAAEAGVSRTTLHRNFADREALGYAIFDQKVQEFDDEARKLAGTMDGFLVLLDLLAERLAENAGLSEALSRGTGGLEDIARLRHRAINSIMPLLAAAQAAGDIRAGIDADDLDLIIEMLAGALRAPTDDRLTRAQRAIALIRPGLLPCSGANESATRNQQRLSGDE